MYGDERRSRIIAESAGFIALIAAGSWISFPFFPVPITLQTFFVLLSGAVMKRWAVVPATLYLVLGVLGLPIFHNGTAGLGVLLGPTGGYILGFIGAALVAGLAYEHASEKVRVAGLALATGVIYLFGVPWLVLSTGMSAWAAVVGGMLLFLPGDAVKAAAAYLVARRLA